MKNLELDSLLQARLDPGTPSSSLLPTLLLQRDQIAGDG